MASALSGASIAQTPAWPSRPVRIIVAYPTGGPADSAARQLAERLASALGQPVIVENRAGASGTIGMDAVAKAAPDGHTLGFSALSPLTLSPHLGRVPYDPMKDIVPVSRVMFSPVYLMATPAFDGARFADVLAQARARPGRLTWATSGVASVGHLILETLTRQAGISINHVPYKGGGQILTDAAGGQFDLFTANPSPTLGAMIQQGRVRVLAVSAPERLGALPETPTLAELGHPGASLTSVFGVFAPKQTPSSIVARLNTEINSALASKDFQDRLAKLDTIVSTASAADFSRQVAAEHAANAKIVRDAGLQTE